MNQIQLTSNLAPWRITLDTNPEDCNLNCVMCEEHSKFSDFKQRRKKEGKAPRRMPFALLENTLLAAKKLGIREVIPSTMGEPLLYGYFEELLELVRALGMQLNLTTNGTFPKHGAKNWAEKFVPITSDVKISWNACTPETDALIMQGSDFDKRLDNVREVIRVRDKCFRESCHYCRITFQMTFLKTNIPELPGIIRLAHECGVDRLKGHHLWDHFTAIQELSMDKSQAGIEAWNKAAIQAHELVQELERKTGRGVLLENFIPLKTGHSSAWQKDKVCPFLGKEIWINADGWFNPCCAPDEKRKTLGNFGNVSEHSLEEILLGESYQELLKNYQHHPLCQSCPLKIPTEKTKESENEN